VNDADGHWLSLTRAWKWDRDGSASFTVERRPKKKLDCKVELYGLEIFQIFCSLERSGRGADHNDDHSGWITQRNAS
jgi:hypothetical protein